MMKKLFLLCVASMLSFGVWANMPYKATTECEFDYDDFQFCSKSNITKYKAALAKRKPNYDSTKILLNVGSAKNIRYVVIDTQTGLVFPLRDTIYGFTDWKGSLKKPPLIQFSVNSPLLCIQGNVFAYRDAYDNVEVCYTLQKDQWAKYGQEFRRVDIPKSLVKSVD